MKHLIAPSLLSADFANLGRDCEMLNNSEADWFHIDIMDGHFVPNISFGFPVMKAIKKYANKPMDVHLMISNPDQYLEEFKAAGADIISIHYEACNHLHRSVQKIKSLGLKASVALNPHTPVSLLKDILSELDMVLIMSVNPGFGGQSFIDNSINKIKDLRTMAEPVNPNLLIQVDGGVGIGNIQQLVEAGANVLVAGSSVFNAENPIKAISDLKHLR